jgi:NADP-dependent 3-hydroxy acid dehydrogenase YdfG
MGGVDPSDACWEHQMGLFSGKAVIITGASSGIGEATAVELAQHGADLCLVARRQERLQALVGRLSDEAARVSTITADLRNEDECRVAVEKAISEHGRIDVLINNAGVMLLGPVVGADTGEWRQMVEINVLGLMYMTHAVLPHMLANGSGDIVNISSVAGRVARAGLAVYNATKFAVNGFSEALRQEVAKDQIRVTVIEPGFVETELRDHITHAESRERSLAVGRSIRVLTAADIARAVTYILGQPGHVGINELVVRPTEQI